MSDITNKFSLPSRYKSKTTSIWVEYAELAKKYQPIDLGQGFPNFPPPKFVQEALNEVANSSQNNIFQYTRGPGHPRLVNALSNLYSKFLDRKIAPNTQILVTLGAYHALFVTIMGLIDQGDEVIIIEPFFECYAHNVETAGGIPRFSPLKISQNGADLDYSHLESLFNQKTKAIIVNTPHNPLGKVFTRDELIFISELCKKWNVVCISDEVYEWLVYDSKKHVRIASLPEMWERTITIGSAGKVFGATGFKLGWAYGPYNLLQNLQQVHVTSVRVSNTFLQEAVAICCEKELQNFGKENSYLVTIAKNFEKKRDFLYKILLEVGFKPVVAHGGYFLIADWSEFRVDLSQEQDEFPDFRFSKWLTKNVGVQCIPVTPFYSKNHKGQGKKFVRFCFIKSDDYLEKGGEILRNFFLTKVPS